MLDQFTYEEYESLLGIVKAGRRSLCFSDCRNPDMPSSFFLLRHDIDFSLPAALKMARLEAERDVRATYFLLLNSDHYNLLSTGCCNVPRQLIALGHEVGLHYDVRVMSERDNIDLHTQLQNETDLLSELAGSPVQSIAMHNPSVCGDDPFAGDNHFINAYDPQFTKAIVYFSDSCGAWRDKTYDVFNRCNIPDKLQLLIHPFYWAETPGDRWERLNKWMDEARQSLEERREQIRQVWINHVGLKEHERRRTNGCT